MAGRGGAGGWGFCAAGLAGAGAGVRSGAPRALRTTGAAGVRRAFGCGGFRQADALPRVDDVLGRGDVVGRRQRLVVEVVAPGDAVQRVVLAHGVDIAARCWAGSRGSGGRRAVPSRTAIHHRRAGLLRTGAEQQGQGAGKERPVQTRTCSAAASPPPNAQSRLSPPRRERQRGDHQYAKQHRRHNADEHRRIVLRRITPRPDLRQ